MEVNGSRIIKWTKRDVVFLDNRNIKINILYFKSLDGLKIAGYFCRPSTREKVSCVVVASAGVHGSFFKKDTHEYDTFHLKWCWELVNNNIATFYIDKRGSYGYGNRMQSLNEIGGKEIDDIGIGSSFLRDPSFGIGSVYGYGVCRMCVTFLIAELKYRVFNALFLESGFYDIEKQLLTMDEKYVKDLIGQYSLQNFPYKQRSPIFLTKEIPTTVPLLLVHGKNDNLVSAEQSIDFYLKLRKNGHEKVQLKILRQLHHNKIANDPDNLSGRRILSLLLNFIRGGA